MDSTQLPDPIIPMVATARTSRSKWLWIAVLSIVVAGGLYWQRQAQTRAEQVARRGLEALGGLLVMDANRTHVASLNLSAFDDVEKLEKAMQCAGDLRWLQILDLTGTDISSDQLASIAHLRSVVSLHLSQTSVGDPDLDSLSGMKRLEALYLANTRISDEGLHRLGALPKLKILDISGNHVEGDLRPLSKARQLTWLVLKDTPLSVDATASLASIKHLSRLTITEDQLSPESLNSLRLARPALNIK